MGQAIKMLLTFELVPLVKTFDTQTNAVRQTDGARSQDVQTEITGPERVCEREREIKKKEGSIHSLRQCSDRPTNNRPLARPAKQIGAASKKKRRRRQS